MDALDDRMPARAALREAVVFGAPVGYIWRWMDAGPGLELLLRDLRVDVMNSYNRCASGKPRTNPE